MNYKGKMLIIPVAAALALSYPHYANADIKKILKGAAKVAQEYARQRVVEDSLEAERYEREERQKKEAYENSLRLEREREETQRKEREKWASIWVNKDRTYRQHEIITSQEVAKYIDAILPNALMNVRITKTGIGGKIEGHGIGVNYPPNLDEADIFSYGGYNAVMYNWASGKWYSLYFKKSGLDEQISFTERTELEQYINFLNGSGSSILDAFPNVFNFAAAYIDSCGEIEVTYGGTSHGDARFGRVSYRGKGNNKKFAIGAYWPQNSVGTEIFN
ncbi:MAG: hypothetical protein QMD85_04970, partial [Candidatus Aenigmarchaeota archaeon]|nr:hypothetical protein [Candidatus Aenigmarchaeota archaeon]